EILNASQQVTLTSEVLSEYHHDPYESDKTPPEKEPYFTSDSSSSSLSSDSSSDISSGSPSDSSSVHYSRWDALGEPEEISDEESKDKLEEDKSEVKSGASGNSNDGVRDSCLFVLCSVGSDSLSASDSSKHKKGETNGNSGAKGSDSLSASDSSKHKKGETNGNSGAKVLGQYTSAINFISSLHDKANVASVLMVLYAIADMKYFFYLLKPPYQPENSFSSFEVEWLTSHDVLASIWNRC
nr:hypothetical protein [Tanacetum cinerariifolium]